MLRMLQRISNAKLFWRRNESCADGLLIRADEGDVRRAAALRDGVNSGGALPRGGSDEAFAKNAFHGETISAPTAPRRLFSGIEARHALQAVAQQRVTVGRQLRTHCVNDFRAWRVLREQMRVGHAIKLDGRWSRAEIERARAVAQHRAFVVEPERVRREPVVFFCAHHEARIGLSAGHPIRRERESLRERTGITDERVINSRRADERSEVTAGCVENRFGKHERTCGCGITQRLVVKAARVIHAAGHHRDDDAEIGFAGRYFRGVIAERLERSGNQVMRDDAGAAQSRVREKRRSRGGRGNLPHAQLAIGPARSRHFAVRDGRAGGERRSKNIYSPTCGRDDAGAMHENAWCAHVHLRKMTLAFAPPKPNELLSA